MNPFALKPIWKITERGISLIEIPIALVVLGIVLVMATRTFMTSGKVQKDSHITNQATAFASAKLNELESTPVALITNGSDQIQSSTGFSFTRRWTVTQPISGSNAKSIQIEVHWLSNQRDESVRLASLIR